MFDDTDNKTSDNADQGENNASPAAPSAASINKEESPVATVQPVPASAPGVPEAPKGPLAPAKPKLNAGVEDIFSDTEAGEAESIKPAAFQPKASPAPTEDVSAGEPSGHKLRKIIIPLVLIVVLGAVGVGGVYGYKYVINLIGKEDAKVINITEDENKQDDTTRPTGATTEPKDDVIEPVEAVEPVQSPPSSAVPAVTSPQDTDTDGDGLSDPEEITLGTNINSVDTDNDGLFDREEVYVYKTNPTNEDTDGDGFLDGAEVQDGYNPNGSGKLYEIN